MSLTVQQLLSDAKRLSSRLRDHDQSADHLISRAQEVLKEVDAMRQYQEDVENLNEVAHNRPRAQLVLGIQQENRHIRTLQQENKELRAALEEHQNALELIMSKYRQHVTRLVNTPHPDVNSINNQKIQMLAERTEKVCEMAAVMKEAVRVDEETCNQQQELMARLITENKGLRELLEISQKSNSSPRIKKVVSNVHKEVQTDNITTVVEQVVSVTLPMPTQPRPPPRSPKISAERSKARIEPVEQVDNLEVGVADFSSGDSDETGSEDESVKYDTIKLADRRNKNLGDKEKVKTIDDSATLIKVCNETKLDEKPKAITGETAECVILEKSEVKEESANIVNLNNSASNTNNSPIQVVQSDSPDKSLIPPDNVLTEGQKNQVLVDSLVDQLVRDSVETSTGASSIFTQSAALDSPATISTTELTTNPISDPVQEMSPDQVNAKPHTDQSEEKQSSPTTQPSQQKPAKTANSSKAESSPSRANNSKGKNKGNKNTPKKGNKK